jgi:F-type H+-transporting ATPase subunit epsilon
MAKTFHLTIAEVGRNIFDGEAISVSLPGAEGIFTVLANHEAFVTPLKEGEAKIEAADGERHHVPISAGGIAEISGNQATIIL